jgi:hypothetical protein
VGQKQTINWTTSDDISGKRPVKLQYIKGGKTKNIASVPNRKGAYLWKPKKADAGAGTLKLCVSIDKKSAPVCDQADITVAP